MELRVTAQLLPSCAPKIVHRLKTYSALVVQLIQVVAYRLLELALKLWRMGLGVRASEVVCNQSA
jgi:hypothetical protein